MQKAVYRYLSLRVNRQSMINKIDNGLKNKDISFTKDQEVEEFQRGFLDNWEDLTKHPQSAEDLKGLEGQELKDKIHELKMQFCEWVSSDDAVSEGYAYAYNKKELIKGKVTGAGKSVMSKAKAAMNAITGDKKVGRNDPCPCGSGIKYKKCCGNPLNENTGDI